MKLLMIGEHGQTGFGRVLKSLGQEFLKLDIEIYQVVTGGFKENAAWPLYIPPTKQEMINKAPYFSKEVETKIRPDLILVLQDHWHLNKYSFDTPTIAYIPVDGFGSCIPKYGNIVPVFYNKFGLKHYSGPEKYIVPHGVDTTVFFKEETTLKVNPDWFIVGNVNVAQPRKRLDLTIQYFADFVKKVPDERIKLLVHASMSTGISVTEIARYYGIADRLIIFENKHVTDKTMRDLYNAISVQVTTTGAEAWGLTTLEGMACGVPQICPGYSGIGEWTKDHAVALRAESYDLVLPGNMIVKTASKKDFVEGLERLYKDNYVRETFSRMSLRRASELSWKSSAAKFMSIFRELC